MPPLFPKLVRGPFDSWVLHDDPLPNPALMSSIVVLALRMILVDITAFSPPGAAQRAAAPPAPPHAVWRRAGRRACLLRPDSAPGPGRPSTRRAGVCCRWVASLLPRKLASLRVSSGCNPAMPKTGRFNVMNVSPSLYDIRSAFRRWPSPSSPLSPFFLVRDFRRSERVFFYKLCVPLRAPSSSLDGLTIRAPSYRLMNRLARPLTRPALPPTASAPTRAFGPGSHAALLGCTTLLSAPQRLGPARPAARSRCITSPYTSDSRSGPVLP